MKRRFFGTSGTCDVHQNPHLDTLGPLFPTAHSFDPALGLQVKSQPRFDPASFGEARGWLNDSAWKRGATNLLLKLDPVPCNKDKGQIIYLPYLCQ